MAPNMKNLLALSALSLVASILAVPTPRLEKKSAEPGLVRMPIAKRHHDIAKRQDYYTVSLRNAEFKYFVTVDVGNPPQSIDLELDTGSSTTWMFSPEGCSDANCNTNYFDTTLSSTYSVAEPGVVFTQAYVDGSSATGNYFFDTLQVGDAVVNGLEMGLGTTGSGIPNGIMGVSFDQAESEYDQYGTTFPTIIDAMVTQGVIASHQYSLWLDDLASSTGTIMFGGYDTSKYQGDLVALPIVSDSTTGPGFWVNWDSISVTTPDDGTVYYQGSALPRPTLLDSGTAAIRIPTDIYNPLAAAFGINSDGTMDCDFANAEGSVDFYFEGATISVPFSELVFPADPSTGACYSAFIGDDAVTIFGDPFLRSAYVVYDLDDMVCGIAQTVFA